MKISTELGSTNCLYCELCDYTQFSSYTEFHTHHLIHIRQPLVRLVKLNSSLFAKLQTKSYKLKTGVARRSLQSEHVPPLKISLTKQQGVTQFHVIKLEKNSCENHSPILNGCSSDSHSKSNGKDSTISKEHQSFSDVEGKNLLQRFGAQITVSGKGQNLSGNGKKETDALASTGDVKKENILERLSGIEGISISTKSKSNGNSELKLPPGISISTKQKPIDISQLKIIKEPEVENDKKSFDKNKILERLSGSGLISIASKPQAKGERELETNSKCDSEQGSPVSQAQDVLERLGSRVTITSCRSKSDSSNDSSDSRSSIDGQTSQASEEGKPKTVNENSSDSTEQKKFVRVKNSTFSKNKVRSERQQENSPKERRRSSEESKEKESESGIDILERLTDNLNSTVGGENSGKNENPEDSKSETGDGNEASESGSEQPHPSTGESLSDEPGGTLSNFNEENEENTNEDERENCSLILGPSGSSGQDEENADFSALDTSDAFEEDNSVAEENNDIGENAVSFASLTTDDQGDEPNDQQSSFWSDINNGSDNVDQPQQDPLMTPDNAVPNGEGLSQNFLHNFLEEPQHTSNNIPPENSEFMSLDRLGQTQHQQPPPFDLNGPDSNTPMEQLSQQVQRIPNPTPQINVVPQHHMQAPQPPPLHTGVPLSPQHMSPQQPNYNALGHMPPPMPPPLYQGYMFNQNFPPQTPQQMPRPPMMQQRPHLQPRSFESLAAPQRPRMRPMMKRNPVRLPSPHEMVPPKQRRIEPPLQARPQMQNPMAKLPSGITVTPPKKALEANKVANVLASRGITVTPAASRQSQNNGNSRTPQRTPTQSPTFNIGSGVSITSSNQNRNNGGFAIPAPRRTPIVNHNIDRPERCTTVDLTQDDDFMQQFARSRGALGRFPCNQCGKVFSSSITLENHKATHRAAAALPYKCDKCTAQYTTAAHLQQHKLTSHKAKPSAPDLAIPIVDLNHPGAREQLVKCGVYNFIPLAQLQSNNNGYFGVPIIQLDTAKQKAVSNLSILGAGNILVLGKMKALAPQPNH